MMDLKPVDGNWHVVIGPWAKLIMGVSGTLLAAGAIWLIASVNTLLLQQAVTNERLLIANRQLDAVPGLNERIIRLESQVDQIKFDVSRIKSSD